MNKKFYLIVLTDFGFETLIMLSIKIIVKLDSVTNQIKPKNMFKSNIKTKLDNVF